MNNIWFFKIIFSIWCIQQIKYNSNRQLDRRNAIFNY